MEKILVTKAFIPPMEEYEKYLRIIWENGQFTNQGVLLKQLEEKLKALTMVENVCCVANGTLALQLALASLEIESGEIITTPFSYVATISSILWQRCKPVFVDIEPYNFTINAQEIEKSITKQTKAILAVHVFGYACDVDKIQEVAQKHKLKVIYDAAHTFGASYKGKSLLSYGDISTSSFHATKLFHTCEGGACFIKDKNIAKKLELQRRFGHTDDNHYLLGINAKMSELHSAMGLTVLPYFAKLIAEREKLSKLYDENLSKLLQLPKKQVDLEYNYAYYPVLFKNENELLHVFSKLKEANIFPRRYFYPSLNLLDYLEKSHCPISEDISSRIACLPLYSSLSEEEILLICKIITNALK